LLGVWRSRLLFFLLLLELFKALRRLLAEEEGSLLPPLSLQKDLLLEILNVRWLLWWVQGQSNRGLAFVRLGEEADPHMLPLKVCGYHY